jgi:hypothetical protein
MTEARLQFVIFMPQWNNMDKNQLAIEINGERMSAFRLSGGTAEPVASMTCANKSDSGYKQTLQELLAACGNPDNYDSFSCSYSREQCTLVPMMLFGESKPELILNLTAHLPIPKEETDYNRLPEWSIVNVYRIPMWVKSALIVKIPRVVIQHELSHVLRYLNTGSTIPLRTHVILQESHFCMVARKDGQIAHASYQSYQSAEDVLYHLLYAYQKLGITTKGEIFLHASSEELRTVAGNVKTLAASIEQLRVQTITTHLYEHIQFQTLCV